MKLLLSPLLAVGLLGIGNAVVSRAWCANASTDLTVAKLLCEYTSQPNHIDRPDPRFSWILQSNIRGQVQTAYQILVSDRREKLADNISSMWDSGRVVSGQTTHIVYRGKSLETNRHYFWKAILWDKDGRRIDSPISEFWTSLLDRRDWTARWIGAGPTQEPRPDEGFFSGLERQKALADTIQHNGRSVLLRREFHCRDDIIRARVFVTGLGFYELNLNGRKIGDHVLAPAKTNYRKQILYDTYDVTDQLAAGANAIGIHLGNGWFNPYKKWWQPYRMQWFGAKRAILQLHIEYADGRKEIVQTDSNWKQAPGPVLQNCIYDGEVFDAALEPEGWMQAEFDDSHWKPVNLVAAPGGKLISHRMPPIRVTQKLTPARKWKTADGNLVYDLGQNFAGWIRITAKGPKGTKLVLRFAEDLNQDDTINVASNEHAKATATWILKGEGTEVYEPRFTFFGFRYVEVNGEPELPAIDDLRGCVVQSACEATGSFECGNRLINKIHRATVWSQRSNMMGYPLDCPQRDERLGWLGDAQVTAEEAMCNMEMPLFYENWLSGIQCNQDEKTGDIPIISPRPYIWDEGVEWSSTYLIVAWHHYLHYGDKEIIAEHYRTMNEYMKFLKSLSTGHIIPPGWIGDWGSLVEGWKEGEPASVPTAFYYYNATLMARFAQILGRSGDAEHFASLAEQIQAAYHKAFFNEDMGDYNDGSQMANAFPLFLGLVPSDKRSQVLGNLVDDIQNCHDGHLTTGVLGTKYMIDALAGAGRADVAYRMAIQTGTPSWATMVEHHTTLCEFWNLKQSHNHVMMGSIDAFFYRTLAGIRPDPRHPGFEKVVIAPFMPESLPWARASIQTVRGTIVSAWEQDGERCKVSLEIPANTTADVTLPAENIKRISESSRPVSESEGVTLVESIDGASRFSIESGRYEFTIETR